MQRILAIGLAFFLITAVAYGATEHMGQGMVDKAVDGAINMATAIVEVPMQIYKGTKTGFEPIKSEVLSKVVGGVLGIGRGVSHAAGRFGWGTMELLGFWTANHQDNNGVGIPLDAKYAWEMGEQYSIFKPSLSEGLQPVGAKFIRGAEDALLGVLEVPGQIKQENKTQGGNMLVGFFRGMWFWFSREVNGFTNLATCIVPNPVENLGYPFHQDAPADAAFK